jgi:hypothetical protein
MGCGNEFNSTGVSLYRLESLKNRGPDLPSQKQYPSEVLRVRVSVRVRLSRTLGVEPGALSVAETSSIRPEYHYIDWNL